MAHHDRCLVCDYTQADGSPYAGASPYSRGKVRRFGEDFLCSECATIVDQARADLRPPEEVDEVLYALEE